MKRRIFGLENEYGLTCTLNGQRRLSPDNVARYLFEKVIPGARNANVFLENGARLYLDTGFHPEYATPECDDVAELVIHDKAGERIVEDLLHQAEKRLREDGISGNILLFKNNTDSAGNSYGCHENYLVSRDVQLPAAGRGADPVLRHPADLRRGRQGAADAARLPLLPVPARPAHLPGDLGGHHVVALDHQHARRAARRRRALPAPARDRGRLEHVRGRDLSEDRDHRARARHDRGRLLRPRLLAAVPGPGHPRHLPRPDAERDDQAQGRAQRSRRSSSSSSTSSTPRATSTRSTPTATTRDVLARWTDVLEKLESDPMQLSRELDWVIKRAARSRTT